MTIILDPRKSVPFQPRPDGPTYYLRAPKVADRARYAEAVTEEGGVQWRPAQLIGFAKDSLKRLLADDAYAEAREAGLGVMDAYLARLEAAIAAYNLERTDETNAELTEALKFSDELEELIEDIGEHDQRLLRKFGQSNAYWQKAGVAAAKMFLVGWDRAEKFQRKLDGPTEETLSLIPDNDYLALAFQIRKMMEPDEARMGNSELGVLWATEGERFFAGWTDYTADDPLAGPARDGYCLTWLHGRAADWWPSAEVLESTDWRELWEQHSVLRVHPSYILSAEDRALIDLWAAYRRDGMGGVGHLPFGGGYAEQPSGLMRALEVMDAADARIRARLK